MQSTSEQRQDKEPAGAVQGAKDDRHRKMIVIGGVLAAVLVGMAILWDEMIAPKPVPRTEAKTPVNLLGRRLLGTLILHLFCAAAEITSFSARAQHRPVIHSKCRA